ncbi:MAG: hypothetical protein A3H69_05375 [Candidatus Sungbacteria bacterium RIFCSPLOWO2_02_FULL_47_9]|uniref:DUF4015 domain-containing protein n=1 Tax=Candidatus Sungbacteria bacterium RIFCSPHIGHO2_01_FULL_47_32 TaxID=1802264 RepID=A0A1G2K6C7_9BACT|nr:MAG: hypothetical protein UX72_C0002G0004 [Parcubacteria group bacterium GW2011_GWA2_47_10]OGZ94999.1 MAG: hypothetical protein A2633_06055 [Candidatus Sungbacteria bacterium RIFCSPHIGHO2_01_FULL_47_32]OGZ99385.1 MAG: hypothetical protein A3D57_00820 [Candidatus Sungbacteria bacterium RIFCSPHIGHO2_02_FULL_46_12]OHA05664.1 MAG: hypothetical protein A3A28_04440 [Candidatus Sungbacteria bacterium RIFCSPLOWO2_01_FULL_47_32]OHA10227.1 MAG: hypothetical protein A3H69_05375 [Candidatus Sungbacteria
MKKYIAASILSLGIIGAFWLYSSKSVPTFYMGRWSSLTQGMNFGTTTPLAENEEPKPKTREELIADALLNSQYVKGVYMTADVANDQGVAARRLRGDIEDLLKTTELNGVVIDVKEAKGSQVTSNLKPLIDELKAQGVWTIARMAVFPDSSQTKEHPEYYVKNRNTGAFWKDSAGRLWMDPASPAAREYLAAFAMSVIDLGFDELQFDYIRFPSDGDVKSIIYPAYDPKTPKYTVLKSFFEFMNKNLKDYKPDIILSADLFGYVATQANDLGIGQRMEDVGSNFDYVSFMLYPSHYYAGFTMPADPSRSLPKISYPYRSKNVSQVVSNQPYDVVYRSLVFAQDFLAGKISTTTFANLHAGARLGTTTASTTPAGANATSTPRSVARMRPWLQDFDLGADTSRGIVYDAAKVKAQIKAAEDAGASGWLLWNARNVYTEEALKKKTGTTTESTTENQAEGN